MCKCICTYIYTYVYSVASSVGNSVKLFIGETVNKLSYVDYWGIEVRRHLVTVTKPEIKYVFLIQIRNTLATIIFYSSFPLHGVLVYLCNYVCTYLLAFQRVDFCHVILLATHVYYNQIVHRIYS